MTPVVHLLIAKKEDDWTRNYSSVKAEAATRRVIADDVTSAS